MPKKAFQPAVIGGIPVKNRIVRSATHERMAVNGAVSDQMLTMYENLAKGQVGLIITGYMAFSDTDHPEPKTLSINRNADMDALKHLTAAVHEHGTKIVMQISHQGSQLLNRPKTPVFSASAVTDPISGITPEPFSSDQIKDLIRDFAAAASRAKNAGFDGVQIHGAHGYMLSKFVSPVYNTRTDEFGGSNKARALVVNEILRETKKTCGPDFPVWIKLNSNDFDRNENGLTESDFLAIVEELAQNGIDAVEVSGGTMAGTYSPCRSKKHIAYHVDAAKKLAERVNTSIIPVGGIRGIDCIETILEHSGISAVSLSRPLIREPNLVKRWIDGDLKDPTCVSCNGCFNPESTVCFHDLSGEKKAIQKEVMKLFSPRD